MEENIPPDVNRLVIALTAIHGAGQLRYESKGLHLYLASPKCLEQDGEAELNKRHMTVNLDKALARGRWTGQGGSYDQRDCVWCHKTDTKYKLDDLLEMDPLEKRGIKASLQSTSVKMAEDREWFCIKDAKGNLIPDHPGMVVPITSLSPGHPAYDYLDGRGYSLTSLWDQFRCSYCYMETTLTDSPKGPKRRGYRALPGGFCDTPQGRIIFYIDVRGEQKGWQARVIDRIQHDFLKQHWHPYKGEWVTTHIKTEGEWVLVPDLQAEVDATQDLPRKLAWDPSKYYTGKATRRSEVIIGFDAAVQWCQDRGKSTGILAEGPLDCGRCGPPGMGMIGKYLNQDQAKLLSGVFRKIIYVADKGDAGAKAQESVLKHMALTHTEVHTVDVSLLHEGDLTKKDMGDASTAKCWEVLHPML